MTQSCLLTESGENTFLKVAVAGVLIYMLAPLGMTLVPLMVGGAVRDLGLSDSQAGYLASIDLAGVVATSVSSVFWIHRVNWRWVGLLSLLVVILGSLASALADNFASLAAARFTTQLGSGGLYSLALLVLAQTPQPSRFFSLGISATIALSVVIFLWVPNLSKVYGSGVLYAFHGLVAVLVIPVLWWLPVSGQKGEKSSKPVESEGRDSWLVVSFVLLFAVAACCGALWAYIERIGDAAGFSADYVGEVLAATQVVSLITALAASVASTRWGRLLPVSLGLILFMVAMWMIQSTDPMTFMIGACATQVAWIFVLPYLMLLCVENDSSNRYYLLITAFKMGGFSAGPAIVATLLGTDGLVMVSWVGGVFLIVALLLALPVCRLLDRATESQ